MDGDASEMQRLIAAGADTEWKDDDGDTALMWAAGGGHTEMVKALVAAGADKEAKDNEGQTAADYAMRANQPIIFAFLDPEAAKRKGVELRKAFADAKLAHVISTRFKKDKSQDDDSCDPFVSAQEAKQALEATAGVCVFDPNGDNAFLMTGDPEAANAIWLQNWRDVGLARARETGGRVIQIVVPPGLSDMQVAEAGMAEDKGVDVVRLDCSEVEVSATEYLFKEMAGWAELTGLAERVARGEKLPVPPTRQELVEENEKLRAKVAEQSAENKRLLEELERLRRAAAAPNAFSSRLFSQR